MGRRPGSKNRHSLSESYPLQKTTQTKSKFWITSTDFISYCLSHPEHSQQRFNKNYGLTKIGQQIGIVKVSEDVFRTVQKEKQEGHKEAIEYTRNVTRGIL